MLCNFKGVLSIFTILWIIFFLWSPGVGKSGSKSGSKKGSKKGSAADMYCFDEFEIEECKSRVFESAGDNHYDVYCKKEEKKETCRKVEKKSSKKYAKGRCPFCSFVRANTLTFLFNFRQKKRKRALSL